MTPAPRVGVEATQAAALRSRDQRPSPSGRGAVVREPQRRLCRERRRSRADEQKPPDPTRVWPNYHLLERTQRMISSLGSVRPLGPSILYNSARKWK